MTVNKLPENIQEWVDALRGDDYTQQQGTLKGPDGYCCLGVYCSVMGREPPEVTEKDLVGGDEGPKELYDFCAYSIKEPVLTKGVQMNDGGKSFLEIADMIEKEYLKEDS